MTTWFETLTGLSLQTPQMLLLGLLVPLVLFWRQRRGAPAVCFAPAAFLLHARILAPADRAKPAPLPRSWRVRLAPLPAVLHVAGVLVAVVALARPVQRTVLPFQSEGIDIVLCLDVSSSMAANDLDAEHDRLAVAKAAAARFIAGRPDDRIGLVAFARYPDLRCPPTLDHAALAQIMDEVPMVTGDSQEDATGIGTALARAAQVLQRSAARSKVVVLLTDGEETVATGQTNDEIAPRHAAQLCREVGVRVYAIAAGIGNRAADGTWTPVDTGALEQAATLSQGRFFAARDATAVSSVYAEIDRLERQQLPQPSYRIDERFLPFLGAALLLIGAAWLLRRTGLAVLP